jgi:phage major head subunit gpT-like protein
MPLNWQDVQNAVADSQARFGADFERLLEEGNWQKIASLVPNASLTTDLSHLGFFPTMRRWIGDRHLKRMRAYTYRVESKLFESTVTLSRRNMLDAERNRGDRSLAAALGLPETMRREALAAGDHYDNLVFDALANGHLATDPIDGSAITCFDGQPYFDTAHPNANQSTFSNEDEAASVDPWFVCDSRVLPLIVLDHQRVVIENQFDAAMSTHVFLEDEYLMGLRGDQGVAYTVPQACFRNTETFSEAELDSTIDTMLAYVTDQGEPLKVNPDTIIYGPSNRAVIEELILEDRKGSGDSNRRFFGRFKLIMSNRL